MMTDELPPLWVRKMAASLANTEAQSGNSGITADSVLDYYTGLALCRLIAKYERPPVDEAELQRRQDARDAGANTYAADEEEDFTEGNCDSFSTVQSAYIALCHRDNVTPVPVEEWVK